ncbi:MAG TPA: TonB-dependent receptor [Gemmatimonadaceae bacterium]|jgi:outer membrane receptor protein involved in Fe transport|nr:TonB-dependent receptor [Gemmatimonadaceae bacterium]
MSHDVRSGSTTVLALWLSMTMGLAASLGAQATGSVRGTVIDKESLAPIRGASVTLKESGDRTRTSDVGSYAFSAVPAGTYTLIVVAIGHVRVERPVALAPGQSAVVDVTMQHVVTGLSGVVVTASRTATQIRDVPAAVNVLTDSAILQATATNFTEAIKTVPGVSVGSFGENFNSIQMRGVPRFGNENEGTLILLDGVPQTDSRNSAQILTLPIDNIDHIEIVKGPNSALYGRTAIAGVVSIFTQNPTPEHHFTADLQTGQWGLVRGAFTASGPIETGSPAGYVLSMSGDEHQSFHDVAPYHKHAASLFAKVTTPLDSATRLVTEVNYALNRGGTPTGDPLVQGTHLLSSIDRGFSPYTNLNLPTAQYNEEHVRTMASVRHDFSPAANVADVFGYRHDLWNFVNDGDFLTGPSAPGGDTVTLFPFSRLRQEDAWYDDARAELRFGPPVFQNRILVGGTFDRNTGTEGTQTNYSDPVSQGVPINYHNPIYPNASELLTIDNGTVVYQGTFLSAYAQDEIVILDRIRLNAGLRYDHDAVDAANEIPGSPTTRYAAAGHKFSPKAGVSIRVLDPPASRGPELSVYAEYATAFRPGTVPTDITVAPNPSNPLAPENITNYEGGIKGSAFNSLIGFDVSAFSMLRDGIEILLPGPHPNTFLTSPGGQEKFRGIETEIDVQPTTHLSLHAFYAKYDGEYGRFTFQQGNTLVDLRGLRVNLSPHDMINVDGTYTVGPVGLTVAGLYEGDKALDPQNVYILPPSFTLNGRLSYRWRKYTAAVGVENILNRVNFVDGEITAPLYAFTGPPRRVIVELRATF